MTQSENIIQSIYRAIKAEQKQGHINTGAIGSFSGYLLDILSVYAQNFSPEIFQRLKSLAEEYSQSSPYKRRGLLSELRSLLSLTEGNFHTESPGKISAADPAAATRNVNSNNIPNAGGVIVRNNSKETSSSQSLQYLKGVGPQRAKQLESLGLYSVRDLIRHYPRRYEIRTQRMIRPEGRGIGNYCWKSDGKPSNQREG